jgi:hypothetical protein
MGKAADIDAKMYRKSIHYCQEKSRSRLEYFRAFLKLGDDQGGGSLPQLRARAPPPPAKPAGGAGYDSEL